MTFCFLKTRGNLQQSEMGVQLPVFMRGMPRMKTLKEKGFMNKKTFTVHANGMDFYCEMMGQGPTMVLVPPGSNDCGPYEDMMAYLADEFTVLTFDPRGGSRSPDPHPRPVTPELFSDDIAALVQTIPLEQPISAFGVSSGGQAVLAFAKFHPDMIRNGVVHEAALGADTPIQNAGFEYFQRIAMYSPKIADALTILSITMLGTGVFTEDTAQFVRIEKNHAYWSQYYLGTVDRGQYFEEDFAHMAPVDFTIGTWTPSWVTAANQATAARGNRPITWVNSAHAPYVTMPKEMADIVREKVKQYLRL
jgi:pimeloyl-ACP methyl ester carboxylesterase